jgi:hypothetical protein
MFIIIILIELKIHQINYLFNQLILILFINQIIIKLIRNLLFYLQTY